MGPRAVRLAGWFHDDLCAIRCIHLTRRRRLGTPGRTRPTRTWGSGTRNFRNRSTIRLTLHTTLTTTTSWQNFMMPIWKFFEIVAPINDIARRFAKISAKLVMILQLGGKISRGMLAQTPFLLPIRDAGAGSDRHVGTSSELYPRGTKHRTRRDFRLVLRNDPY